MEKNCYNCFRRFDSGICALKSVFVKQDGYCTKWHSYPVPVSPPASEKECETMKDDCTCDFCLKLRGLESIEIEKKQKECNHLLSIETDNYGERMLQLFADGQLEGTSNDIELDYCPKCGRKKPDCGKKPEE